MPSGSDTAPQANPSTPAAQAGDQPAVPVISTVDLSSQPSVQPKAQDIVAKTKEYLEKKGQLPAAHAAGRTSSTSPLPSPGVSIRGMTNVLDAMYAKGMINEETLRGVKFESLSSNTPALKLVLAKNLVTANQIQQLKSEMYGIGFIDLASISIDTDVLNKLPKDMAARNMAVAFEETNNRVKVAMEDPLELQKVQFIESILGKKIDSYYASPDAIQNILDTKYGAQIGGVVSKALEDIGVVDINQDAEQASMNQGAIEGAPVSKIVNMLLDYAIKHEASDVHIEPRENRVAVRYRVHGVLSEKLTLPAKLANSVVARIKILSNMKIDEHRIPQDNRFQVKAENKSVDVRVSIMPSMYGEKVVMRLLEKDKGIMQIDHIGLRGPALKSYKHALGLTQGIILITGPTGSGKTVTLASSLEALNTQDVNILTIEDPVEIRINGITQVQVNADVGLTFSNALRAFLRQDPDIIMVGEIRDAETAKLAVQAALTGHLVLATLHTNSAAGALPRLLELGVEPYLLASTINAVVAQRLVRVLDPDCAESYQPEEHIVQLLHENLDGLNGFDLVVSDSGEKIHFDSSTKEVKLYRPKQGPNCGEDAFSGRIGIFEVLTVNEQIGKLIMQHASAQEIERQARTVGMISMEQDGFMKALEGMTTIEEILRVQNI